jgi:hypothetical protein
MVNSEALTDTAEYLLPAALWPWGYSAFNKNEYQEYFLGVKAAGT